MVDTSAQLGTRNTNERIDNCSYDIMTQTGKKADLLHSAVEAYISDAQAANRPDLVNMWNVIKQDELRHIEMLKNELGKAAKEGKLS